MSGAEPLEELQLALAQRVSAFLQRAPDALAAEPPARWLWFFTALMMLGVPLDEVAGTDPAMLERLRAVRAQLQQQDTANPDAFKKLLDQSSDLRPAPTAPATSASSMFSVMMQAKSKKGGR